MRPQAAGFLIADLRVSPAQLSRRAGLRAPPGTLGRCLGRQWPAALWAAALWVPAALWIELVSFSSIIGVTLDAAHEFCPVDFLMKRQDVPGFSCSGSGHRREGVGRAALHPRRETPVPNCSLPCACCVRGSCQGPCPPVWRWGLLGSNVVVSPRSAGGPVCSGAASFFSGCDSWAVAFYLDVEGSGTIFWAPKHDYS